MQISHNYMCVCVCVYLPPSWISLSSPHPTSYVTRESQAGLPVLYSNFLPAISHMAVEIWFQSYPSFII